MPRTHICARMRGNLGLIPIEDVYYFQADQKYVTVHLKIGVVVIEESLKSLETDLSENESLLVELGRRMTTMEQQLATVSNGKARTGF